MKHESWGGMAARLGRGWSPAQENTLLRYQTWLAEEAIPAGALGPAEIGRLADRHIADSLLFALGWNESHHPNIIWDLGSGAGLPGIPLAVLLPETQLRLIDRSGRRTDLLRRAVRVLGLENVEVEKRDIESLSGVTSMMVSRASLGPERMSVLADRHLDQDGVAVLGGSWVQRPQPPAEWEVLEIPPIWLDRTVWLLIMRP